MKGILFMLIISFFVAIFHNTSCYSLDRLGSTHKIETLPNSPNNSINTNNLPDKSLLNFSIPIKIYEITILFITFGIFLFAIWSFFDKRYDNLQSKIEKLTQKNRDFLKEFTKSIVIQEVDKSVKSKTTDISKQLEPKISKSINSHLKKHIHREQIKNLAISNMNIEFFNEFNRIFSSNKYDPKTISSLLKENHLNIGNLILLFSNNKNQTASALMYFKENSCHWITDDILCEIKDKYSNDKYLINLIHIINPNIA